jgi:uncharacterized repeat protein (TIGR02543 family)
MKLAISRLRGLVIAALILALCVPGFVALDVATAPAAHAANLSLDAPTSLSVSSPAGNQLTVTWSAPTNPSAVSITGYQVEHSSDGSTWTTDTSALASNATSYTISGLSPNTSYYVRVAANSAGGLGSYGYPWTKIYSTSATNRVGNSISYDAGYGIATGDAADLNSGKSYSRIRYRMNVTYGGQARYVDADFSKNMGQLSNISESYTTASNFAYLRIPTADGVAANQFEIQGDVNDLTVLSNDSQVENGSGYTGRVEIWPWNYAPAPYAGLSTGMSVNNGTYYDDGDTPEMANAYGSFQLHRLSATPASRQTIFAWNNHGSAAVPEIGFGNHTGNTHRDWTFCSGAGTCASRTGFSLGIYVNIPSTTMNTVAISYSLNGGSGTTPTTTSYSANTSMNLPVSTGLTKNGYIFAGWNNGTTTYDAGASYNVGVTPVTMTAQWTSAMVLDYDVTDTNSYTSGTTLTNRNSAYPNATLTSSSIVNRTTQNMEFSGGTYGTVPTINTSLFSSGLTLDIYGSLGSDSSSAWERFLDFGHNKVNNLADASYNMDVGRRGASNKIFFEIFNTSSGVGSTGQCVSATDQLDNNLHRYTFVLNGSTCALYVDGVQVNVTLTYADVPSAAASSVNYGLPLSTTWDKNYIAKSNWTADANTSGKIRSIRLWRQGITPSNIDLIDSGRLVYKTVNYSSTEATTAMPASDVTTGTLALPLAATATRTGYTLNNWYTTNTRNVVAAGPGVGYAVPSSPTTLYAGWTGSTNTVTYDSQGGSAVTAGSFVTGGSIASAPTPPVKIDNVFAGWATTIGGTAITFPYSPPELTGITLYAKWTLLTTPQAPITLTSTSGTVGTPLSLTISGGTGGGAVSYTVSNGTATGCSISTGSLSASTAGTCMVTATKFSDSTYLSATTGAVAVTLSSIGLSAPSSVSASTNSGVARSLLLSWSAVANATNYTVRVSTGGSEVITVDVSGTSLTLTDARLNHGTSYSIVVRANGTGNYASSAFSVAVGTASTISANVITYVYNGADGGNATASSSYLTGDAAIVLPTPTKTGNSFGGWYSDINLTTSVTGNQTPGSSFSLYAKWTQTSYTLNYSPNYGVAASSTESVTIGNATTLPTPSRANFVFDGWYTASTGGTKIGNAGSSYTPTQSRTIYARWIQSSLYGIAPGNLSRIGTLTANDIVSSSYNGTLGSNGVAVTLPNASLPAGTVVSLDLITDTSYAQSLLTGTNSYILSIAVSWLALDETVPNTNAGKSVQMTITNPSIKAGALVFSIQTGQVVLLGRATVDGSVTVNLTSDPSVYVVATVPSAPQTVVATPSTSSAVVTWTAPSDNGGETITGYTVTLNTGATCTTTLLTCTFTNLTAGTTYTATVIATNSVGNSTSATSTFTATVPSAGGGGSAPVVVPVNPPVKPPVTEEPVTPIKPIIVPVPLVKIVESVSHSGVPVLSGTKIVNPIYFDPNSAKIDKSDIATLKELAASVKGQKGTLLVTGFVKFTNVSAATMKKIATQRALAVTQQLAKLGIKATIGYIGYGPHNTLAPKATDRKVELRWVPATN